MPGMFGPRVGAVSLWMSGVCLWMLACASEASRDLRPLDLRRGADDASLTPLTAGDVRSSRSLTDFGASYYSSLSKSTESEAPQEPSFQYSYPVFIQGGANSTDDSKDDDDDDDDDDADDWSDDEDDVESTLEYIVPVVVLGAIMFCVILARIMRMRHATLRVITVGSIPQSQMTILRPMPSPATGVPVQDGVNGRQYVIPMMHAYPNAPPIDGAAPVQLGGQTRSESNGHPAGEGVIFSNGDGNAGNATAVELAGKQPK